MADSFSNAPDRPMALSAGRPITGLWIVPSPSGSRSRSGGESQSGGESRLEALTPIEREGARWGYQKAGQPFGPGRQGLEIWLELRARVKEG
jgi:hypothetical protein